MAAAGSPKKTSVFLSEEVHRALRIRAAEEDASLSEVAARIIEDALLPGRQEASKPDAAAK